LHRFAINLFSLGIVGQYKSNLLCWVSQRTESFIVKHSKALWMRVLSFVERGSTVLSQNIF
jgi:hypothetical protein